MVSELREPSPEHAGVGGGSTEIPGGSDRRDRARHGYAKPGVCVHPGRRSAWYGDDVQRGRAVAILNALLGSYGRAGGFHTPAAAKVAKYPHPDYPSAKSTIGRRRRYHISVRSKETHVESDPRNGGAEAYPIKAWVVSGCNPMQSIPNTDSPERRSQNLDFIMVVDVLPSETAGWADLVLPECTYLERTMTCTRPNYRDPYVAFASPSSPRRHQSRPNL